MVEARSCAIGYWLEPTTVGSTAERTTAALLSVVVRAAESNDVPLQLVEESIVAGAAFALASGARDQPNPVVVGARLESAGDFPNPTKYAVACALMMTLVVTKYQRSAFHSTAGSGACERSVSRFRRSKQFGSALG